MSKVIGIDLGTTNSVVAIMESGEPKVIVNEEGGRTTPSVVGFTKDGEKLVGQVAKRQAVTNPENTVFSAKRFIGRMYQEISEEIRRVPYKVEKKSNGECVFKVQGKDYSPEQISAFVLMKLKKTAEDYLGHEVSEAVVTVPAYFNDAQRQATKDAGKIAGLDVKRIINEPTAAALAYGFDKKKDEKIVVFDFGGGTFDISVLEVGDDVVEVKSTDGDAHLGGKDIDQKIINWLADEFKKQEGIDVRKDALALQRLDEAAEKAKIELSTAVQTEVNIPFLTSGADGPKHLLLTMTRAKLEELTREFIDQAMAITKRAMEASPFKIADINEIILVGGQTRMPAMQKAVKDLFGKELHLGVNPDEVVAVGAAIQGGILAGDVKGVLLLDVTPLSLSIETMGGVATKLIDKNTTIPTQKSQIFSTAADNQTSVEIHITQGERSMSADNKSLGRFILDGIAPAPRGMPQVEVTFDLDANGILSVTAKDKTTGKTNSIKITASSGLSKEEVEKMKHDAEINAAEDAKKKEMVEAKNMAEQLIHTSEKSLKDAGDKVPADLRKSIEDKIADVKTAKEGTDQVQLKKVTEALSSELSKIGEILSKAQAEEEKAKQSQTPPAGGPTGGSTGTTGEQGGAEGEVKDAEFKEKK